MNRIDTSNFDRFNSVYPVSLPYNFTIVICSGIFDAYGCRNQSMQPGNEVETTKEETGDELGANRKGKGEAEPIRAPRT